MACEVDMPYGFHQAGLAFYRAESVKSHTALKKFAYYNMFRHGLPIRLYLSVDILESLFYLLARPAGNHKLFGNPFLRVAFGFGGLDVLYEGTREIRTCPAEFGQAGPNLVREAAYLLEVGHACVMIGRRLRMAQAGKP